MMQWLVGAGMQPPGRIERIQTSLSVHLITNRARHSTHTHTHLKSTRFLERDKFAFADIFRSLACMFR